VAHTCNPGLSGNRDQEDCSSKPAGQIVPRPYLKKPFTKKGWWSGSRCSLSSNPSTAKYEEGGGGGRRKKKERRRRRRGGGGGGGGGGRGRRRRKKEEEEN
jgi:hypothetical protein